MITIGFLNYYFADALNAVRAYTKLDMLGLLSPTVAEQLQSKIRRKYRKELKYFEKHSKDLDFGPEVDIEELIMKLP
jgi:hypothetical protein